MISGSRALAVAAGRSIRHTVATAGWARLLVAALLLLVFTGVAVVAGAFFLYAFRYLLAEPFAGPVIERYLLEASFAIVFALGTASFVLSASSLIFSGPESRLLASMPIEPAAAFFHRFAGVALLSSWPVLFLGLPALWALGFSAGTPLPYYGYAAVMLLFFSMTIGVCGGILSFVVAAFVGRLSGWAKIVISAAAGIALTVVLANAIVPRGIFSMLTVSSSAESSAAVANIRQQFSWWPSHQFVEAILSASRGANGDAAVTALTSSIVTLVVGFIALAVLARYAYTPLRRRREERSFFARPADVRGRAKLRRPFPRVLRWRHGYLFEKDLLVLSRSPEEIARAGLFGILLVLYVLAARTLSSIDALHTPNLFSLIVTFAFAAIGYFALTFCLRFVFPAFSLEGRSAWVLWSSPVHLHELFSWKFFFWSWIMVAILEIVAVATVVLLQLPVVLAIFFMIAVLCASLGTVALALAFGTAFPSFRDSNPDSLSTSPGGLMTTVFGLAYVAIFSGYVRRFSLDFFTTGTIDVLNIFGMLIVTGGVVLVCWVAAPRYADRIEFPS